jgi:hypothetical protein
MSSWVHILMCSRPEVRGLVLRLDVLLVMDMMSGTLRVRLAQLSKLARSGKLLLMQHILDILVSDLRCNVSTALQIRH